MKRIIKSVIIILIATSLALLTVWRCLQLLGFVQCIPTVALERYHECLSGAKSNGLAELHIKCPFCRGPIKALYYGYADRHYKEYDSYGHPLWKWKGCLSDGSCWQCHRCMKKFDGEGKAITVL